MSSAVVVVEYVAVGSRKLGYAYPAPIEMSAAFMAKNKVVHSGGRKFVLAYICGELCADMYLDGLAQGILTTRANLNILYPGRAFFGFFSLLYLVFFRLVSCIF